MRWPRPAAGARAPDVRVAGGDAVRVEAEHRDGGPHALVVVAPYRREGLVKKTVTYGSMAVSEGVRRVWPR